MNFLSQRTSETMFDFSFSELEVGRLWDIMNGLASIMEEKGTEEDLNSPPEDGPLASSLRFSTNREIMEFARYVADTLEDTLEDHTLPF